MSKLFLLIVTLTFLLAPLGCTTLKPLLESAAITLQENSAVGGEIEIGGIKIGGGYDGDGNLTFHFDVWGLLCTYLDFGCPAPAPIGSGPTGK